MVVSMWSALWVERRRHSSAVISCHPGESTWVVTLFTFGE
jgi:hypothetical protein